MADIPDNDLLYHRVHKNHYKENILNLRMVFRDISGAMSNDWSKHSTPINTRDRAQHNPQDNGVLSMNVGKIRDIPQDAKHEPSHANLSHTNVYGEKTDKALIKFSRIWKWEINPPD